MVVFWQSNQELAMLGGVTPLGIDTHPGAIQTPPWLGTGKDQPPRAITFWGHHKDRHLQEGVGWM